MRLMIVQSAEFVSKICLNYLKLLMTLERQIRFWAVFRVRLRRPDRPSGSVGSVTLSWSNAICSSVLIIRAFE